MKFAWTQILLSIIVGFVLGTVFDKWNSNGCHSHCNDKSMKHCLSGHCHEKCNDGNFKHKMLERLSSKLNLTEDQKTKVATVFEVKHQGMMKLKTEMRPKFEALRKSARADISKLLTPEQQKKFEETNKKV